MSLAQKKADERCCCCYTSKSELVSENCDLIECSHGHATCDDCFDQQVKVETQKAQGYFY